jgi:hypothetical protein
MKFFILSIFSLIISFSQADEWKTKKPNYKKIEKNIKKKNSNLYYESLMNRYLKFDSTMTIEEKRHLYYGYTFNENYSPYKRSPYRDSINSIYEKEEIELADYEKIDIYCDSILKSFPLELRTLKQQINILEALLNEEKYNNKITQAKILLDAIMSSGYGLTKKEAIYVISVNDEYALLSYFNFSSAGQSLIEHYDYLTLEENEANIEGLYFDVTPCLNSLMKLTKKISTP